MEGYLNDFLVWVALPLVGLPALFLIALISATLVPLGSEPALFAYLKLNPDWFWWAIAVATIGNTLGGGIDWLMGYGASKAHEALRGSREHRLLNWFEKLGPKALLLSWLPVIGDPLCVVAGWLRLSWRACLLYMAIGKLLRYLTMTYFLMMIPNQFWKNMGFFFKTLLGAWFNIQ